MFVSRDYNASLMAKELDENRLLSDILDDLKQDCLDAFPSCPADELDLLQLRYQTIEQIKQDITNRILMIRGD